MIQSLYEFVHETLNMCFWTLPALITGVVMVVMGLVHGHNQKKREKDFEEQMEKEQEQPQTAGAEV